MYPCGLKFPTENKQQLPGFIRSAGGVQKSGVVTDSTANSIFQLNANSFAFSSCVHDKIL